MQKWDFIVPAQVSFFLASFSFSHKLPWAKHYNSGNIATEQVLTCFSRTEWFTDGWIRTLLTFPHRKTSSLHQETPQTSATWSVHGTSAGSLPRCGCCGESPLSHLTPAFRTATPGLTNTRSLAHTHQTSCGHPDVIWQTHWWTLAVASVGRLINNK